MKNYLRPSLVRKDAAGRELDSAGKLVKQEARKDLEATDGVDPNRQPEFKNPISRNGNF